MILIWSDYALQDIGDIHAYIAQDNANAASETIDRIIQATEKILEFSPFAGRKGRVKNTRELVIADTNYIVVYRVKQERLAIIAVLHGRREWPKAFP
jgi:toxin ParE1/3/4